MKIYTLTPNPALDVSGIVDHLVPNEKNYVYEEQRDPGGNGINASRIAHRLGTPTLALGFVGGATGDELVNLLKREGVQSRFVRIGAFTRTNVVVCDSTTEQQTRLTFPGPRLTSTEIGSLLRQIRSLRGGGLLILGGSFPPGCPKDFHIQVARAARDADLGPIIDIPAKVLKTYLPPKGGKSKAPLSLFLKPNQTELEEWYGKPLKTDRALAQAAQVMAEHAGFIVVSLAARGAILATRERAWFFAAPKIRARGTVGAGDSMVGAIGTQLLKARMTSPERIRESLAKGGLPDWLRDAIRWGLAAGAATAQVSGTSLAQPREIHRLVKRVTLSPVEIRL